MKRKDFIRQTAIGLATLAVGTGYAKQKRVRIPKVNPQTVAAELGDIRSILLHLGRNMWCDYPSVMMGAPSPEASESLVRKPKYDMAWTDERWRKVIDYAAAAGINMIVLDLGEGLFYPSHPELAIEGTWSIEKMRTEIAYMNKLGIEVIPKLNFSTTHNGWMGDYTHMVSSQPYYRMCEDVIRDVVEIFGHPRFFHIGLDEERAPFLEGEKSHYICVRKGEFWWQDFLHLVREIEKHGARAWMWSDYSWSNDDFIERCPKSVIQQNWFYDELHGGFDIATNTTPNVKILKTYLKLDEAGFDQVPCGTNWVSHTRRTLGVGADDVIGKLVKFCRKNISKEHLMGFMMAPWELNMKDDERFQKVLKGIDLMAEALK